MINVGVGVHNVLDRDLILVGARDDLTGITSRVDNRPRPAFLAQKVGKNRKTSNFELF
jgi:hypothetical protein